MQRMELQPSHVLSGPLAHIRAEPNLDKGCRTSGRRCHRGNRHGLRLKGWAAIIRPIRVEMGQVAEQRFCGVIKIVVDDVCHIAIIPDRNDRLQRSGAAERSPSSARTGSLYAALLQIAEPGMTKAELIAALADVPDNAEIRVFVDEELLDQSTTMHSMSIISIRSLPWVSGISVPTR